MNELHCSIYLYSVQADELMTEHILMQWYENEVF